jgi:hypothetical protein
VPPHCPTSSADDTFEASNIAILHAQDAGVQDIQTLVPVILYVSSAHHTCWCNLVLLTLQHYTLNKHVTSDVVASALPCWQWMDNVILSWIFGAIIIDLQDGGNDRHARFAIKERFLDNHEAHTLHLNAMFRVFVQGDLNVNDYFRKVKSMADALHELSEPVAERTLVLNIYGC